MFQEICISSRGWGAGGAWVNICWVCATDLSEPYPIIVYFLAHSRHHLSHLWENEIFAILTNHFLFIHLYLSRLPQIDLTHLTMKLSIFKSLLDRIFLLPNLQKSAAPFSRLVTLLKMNPQRSQSCRKNATSFSGTSDP